MKVEDEESANETVLGMVISEDKEVEEVEDKSVVCDSAMAKRSEKDTDLGKVGVGGDGNEGVVAVVTVVLLLYSCSSVSAEVYLLYSEVRR